MISIPLTKGFVAVVDDCDADLARSKWCVAIPTRSTLKYARRAICVDGSSASILLHRAVMGRALNRPLEKNELVDHVDGDGLNNVRSNLRLATKTQNLRNRAIPKNNKSGMKGVSRGRGRNKWRVQICVDSRGMTIGYFDSVLDAARAYNEAAVKYFGEFARLNVIPGEAE